MNQTYHVFADGSAIGNPGPGGWARLASSHGFSFSVSAHSPSSQAWILKVIQVSTSVPGLIGWRESDPFDDRTIAPIGVKEVVSRIQLNPEQKRRVFTEALFKK